MERQKESRKKGASKRGGENDEKTAIVDKRKHPRVALKMDIEYQKGTETEKAVSINISRGGVFILSKEPLPEKTPVSVKFIVDPDVGPLEIKGKVAWVRKPEAADPLKYPTGMGVEFLFEDKAKEKTVANFVRDLSDLIRIMAIAEQKKRGN